MNILVTGGAGLVGSNLIDRLRDDHEVLSFSRKEGFDLRDKEQIALMIDEFEPEVVYHLAANAAESRGQVSPIDMTENNLNIFLNVLIPSINAGVKRFIYTSSVAVYGEAEVPYAEDSIPKPKDVYGVNKLAAEQILKILAKIHDFDYTIFRPHNIYGPHQDMSNPYKNVVALIMRNIMEGKSMTIFGKGKMKRAFSYVDDVIDVFVDALDDSFRNQILNVGSCIDIEIATLIKEIETISDKKLKQIHKPARPAEIWNFLADHRRQTMLTYYKETPLSEGLQQTWDFINLPELEVMENEIK